MTMKMATTPTGHGSGLSHSPPANFDIPESLLIEVDFKWLMAGHGWRVDMARFQDDRAYAAQMLDFALNSESSVLRDSAAALSAQMVRAAAFSNDSP